MRLRSDLHEFQAQTVAYDTRVSQAELTLNKVFKRLLDFTTERDEYIARRQKEMETAFQGAKQNLESVPASVEARANFSIATPPAFNEERRLMNHKTVASQTLDEKRTEQAFKPWNNQLRISLTTKRAGADRRASSNRLPTFAKP